jgi:hypothetical protein
MTRKQNHEPVPPLGSVYRSNADRLDALDRKGVRVRLDAPTVLHCLLDRVLATSTPNEFRLSWALNVAGLLREVETAH